MNDTPHHADIIAAQKSVMRREMVFRRDALSPEVRALQTSATMALLFASPQYQAAKNILCTMSFGSEIDTHALITKAKVDGKRIALPRVAEGNQVLALHRLDEDTVLEPSAWGILEPSTAAPTLTIVEIDTIVVPGLAFDFNGNRLGYGRGYYDQLLQSASSSTARIALAFTCQIVPQVPVTIQDAPIHTLISADGITNFQTTKQHHKP
jgi:5-formyltetrahydrofolate cyclo-ligase